MDGGGVRVSGLAAHALEPDALRSIRRRLAGESGVASPADSPGEVTGEEEGEEEERQGRRAAGGGRSEARREEEEAAAAAAEVMGLGPAPGR